MKNGGLFASDASDFPRARSKNHSFLSLDFNAWVCKQHSINQDVKDKKEKTNWVKLPNKLFCRIFWIFFDFGHKPLYRERNEFTTFKSLKSTSVTRQHTTMLTTDQKKKSIKDKRKEKIRNKIRIVSLSVSLESIAPSPPSPLLLSYLSITFANVS